MKYIVIGGVSAILHGVPRMTFDLDLMIEATEENARRLLAAFEEAGMGTAVLTDAQGVLAKEISVFRDYVRIDVQTKTPGIRFDEVWSRRKKVEHKGEHFWMLSKQDLIASKKAAGRDIDLRDLEALGGEFSDSNDSPSGA